jgi:hypothetical protein
MTKVIIAFRHFARALNKTANHVRRGVMHLLHHGVLYSKNIVRFQVAPMKVISSRPIGNVRPSLNQFFTKLVNVQTAICADFLYRISSKTYNQFGKYGFTSVCKVGLFTRTNFTKLTDIP